MSGPFAALAHQFRFNESMLAMVSDGFTPDDWATRLGEANSAHWIVGHLAHSRRYLLRRLGLDLPEEPWEAVFESGRAPGDLDTAFAPVAELVDDFKARGEDLGACLSELTVEAAAEEWGRFPHGDSTVGGGVRFLFMHESYHLGQVGLVRRAVGKPGFI